MALITLIPMLPAILLLGAASTYSDIKRGMIPNLFTVTATAYAVIANAAIMAYLAAKGTLRGSYAVEFSTNLIFAIILGYAFWHIGIWTAGDGKLFIAYAALVPLDMYSKFYMQWTPSILILVNTLLIGAIYLIYLLIRTAKLSHLKAATKEGLKIMLDPGSMINALIMIFALQWIINIALGYAGISLNFFLRVAVMYSLMFLIESYRSRKIMWAVSAVAISRIFFDSSAISLNEITAIVVILFIWRLIRAGIRIYAAGLSFQLFSTEKKATELRKGDLLAQDIIRLPKAGKDELKEYRKVPFSEIIRIGKTHYALVPRSLSSSIPKEKTIHSAPEGLTSPQIQRIRSIGIRSVKVYHTIPFAPFMFLGVILTMMIQGVII